MDILVTFVGYLSHLSLDNAFSITKKDNIEI